MEAFFKTIENKEEIASLILEDFSISDFNLACLACLNVSNIESLKIFSNFSPGQLEFEHRINYIIFARKL